MDLSVITLCIYLTKSPIIDLIDKVEFIKKINGKTSCYLTLKNYDKAINILTESKYFINANLGYLHYFELNGISFDFRSFTTGKYKLGKKSLQININPITKKARADLDFYNPVENFSSLIGHLGEIINLY